MAALVACILLPGPRTQGAAGSVEGLHIVLPVGGTLVTVTHSPTRSDAVTIIARPRCIFALQIPHVDRWALSILRCPFAAAIITTITIVPPTGNTAGRFLSDGVWRGGASAVMNLPAIPSAACSGRRIACSL